MYVSKTDRNELLGLLKQTGSREPDVLHATKQGYLKSLTGIYKDAPIACYLFAALCVLSIFGAPLAFGCVWGARWFKNRFKSNEQAAEAVVQEFLAAPARDAVG